MRRIGRSERIRGLIEAGAEQGAEYMLKAVTRGTEAYREASAGVKVRIAQDFLDREGSAPKVLHQNMRVESVRLTMDDIARIKEEAAAMLPEVTVEGSEK